MERNKKTAQELLANMKYAIFDLDGTLLDSMPIWINLGKTVLNPMGIYPDEDLDKRFKTMTLDQSSRYIKEHFPIDISAEELLDIFTNTVRKGYEEEAPLKPYVMDFIKLLHSRKIPMCVATASERHLTESALQRTGVLPYFEFVMTCTDIGKTKETPDIYLEAMQRLGGNIQNTVVFEDAYFSVISAKNGGFSVVALFDECAKEDGKNIQKTADLYAQSFFDLMK